MRKKAITTVTKTNGERKWNERKKLKSNKNKLFFTRFVISTSVQNSKCTAICQTCTWTQFLSGVHDARTDFKINLMQIATAFPISSGAAEWQSWQSGAMPVHLYHHCIRYSRIVFDPRGRSIAIRSYKSFNSQSPSPTILKQTHSHRASNTTWDGLTLVRSGKKMELLPANQLFKSK